MNVAYINPFIAAVTGTFQSLIEVPATLGNVSIRLPDERLYKLYKVSAVIELSGAVKGRVVLSFAQPVAVALASAALKTPLPPDGGPELREALAAIATQIVAAAKPLLPDAERIELSAATVVLAREVRVPSSPAILLPFDTPAGRLVVEICIFESAGTKAA